MVMLSKQARQVVGVLFVGNLVCVVFFAARVWTSDSLRYGFLFWNLFLAWLPLLFSWWLIKRLPTSRWFSWQNILLTTLWLGFLPNSFYITSDLIHLQSTGEVSLLYDLVMFMSFVWISTLMGFVSLYMIHKQLLLRLDRAWAHNLIALVLLLCSFAIYLGRYLRWSTWDVLINPAGILFDISDRFISPRSHPQTFTTTASFFLLYGSMYWVIWQLISILQSKNRRA